MNGMGPIVGVEWLREHLDEPGVVVVDARPGDDYRAGHIPGARNMDLNAIRLPVSRQDAIARFQQISAAELRRIGVQPGDRVIFYEAISGTLAARGVWMLDYLGIPGSGMLDGGLSAWIEAGGELERAVRPVAPSTIEIAPNDAVLATADAIAAALDSSGDQIRVLDTRATPEYRAGTIPGAIHIDWIESLEPSGRFRPLAEIGDIFARRGLTPDANAEVVTFCGSGYRAAHSYVVLKALGFGSVKNYVPSWSEWGNRGDLPIERPTRP